MTQEELRKKLGKVIDEHELDSEGVCGDWAGELGTSNQPHMDRLLDLINQHVAEVIGEDNDTKIYQDSQDFVHYQRGYNKRGAEAKERAGLTE